MQKLFSPWLPVLAVFCIASLARFCDGIDQEREVHIVYMGALPKGDYQPSSHHVDMLRVAMGSNFGKQYLVRSYTRSFNGFAANLTKEERKRLSGLPGIVSIFPDGISHLQTTRSWDFIGFPESSPRNPTVETNVIVGLIDSGIWPEVESFSDQGLGPVPSKWKGGCDSDANFTCNKKIVGAREYAYDGYKPFTARDIDGHGCHTASIVAGRSVKDVSFYGFAKGTVRGGVPSSRIASYKACNIIACPNSAILAAFDDAISDKVDIISISIGGIRPLDIYKDVIAIGAFHAMKEGILTVQSAGNEGPSGKTASVAPWLFSAAASTTDRKIFNKIILGNSTILLGNAIDTFDTSAAEIPLIYGGTDTRPGCTEDKIKNCELGCLGQVRGKIVVCDEYEGLYGAFISEPYGAILMNDLSDTSRVVPMPAIGLTPAEMKRVKDYMNSTKTPTAKIMRSEQVAHNGNPPMVASFSSRGPNEIVPDILKPDITAPGVEILAAYSPQASVSNMYQDKRSVNYSIISGTSMACPHVSGAAAYVKSFHPDWSPSAIKSALMTTAREMNRENSDDNEFSYGAGHIDPLRATNPGLVYNITEDDYIKFVCSLNYKLPDIGIIFGGNVSCPKGIKVLPNDLNYPSMTAHVNGTFTVEFKRRATNVGSTNSTYKATVTKNSRLDIKVEPSVLSFESLNEEKSFVVSVSGQGLTLGVETAQLVWSDGSHRVRSPIVLY